MEHVITFCCLTLTSGQSKRFKNKNLFEIKGKPLLKYTTDFVKKIMKKHTEIKDYYSVTDCEKIKKFSTNEDIKYIMIPKELNEKRDHEAGMILMRWIHSKIKADYYFMFPATSPKRDFDFISNIIDKCVCNHYDSATTVYKKDRNNYINNGSFWFFSKEQLREDDLIDNKTMLFIDNEYIDIDYQKDIEKIKENI